MDAHDLRKWIVVAYRSAAGLAKAGRAEAT
jgi:hypothetical protein